MLLIKELLFNNKKKNRVNFFIYIKKHAKKTKETQKNNNK
jgi:hypothetical protein